MAGMEQLEIHSKSYLVRWVNAAGGHTISWSITPHKKSINFGLFKHPGAGASLTPSLAASASIDATTPNVEAPVPRSSSSRNDSSTAVEKLKGIGLILVLWSGKCEAEKVSTGKYDVPIDQGGMYALVFDNTFSKQFAKTATFALLTYPTSAPPSSSHHLHHFQAGPLAAASTISLGGKPSPRLAPQSVSTDSIQDHSRPALSAERPGSGDSHVPSSASFYTGVLQKRRRKRHQGFARRFFSLDFTSSTLSYYHNKDSSALRGAIPLALAVISANEKEREISVDSGAEVWHLRAAVQKEFKGWVDALEKASRTAQIGNSSTELTTPTTPKLSSREVNAVGEGEWTILERLAGRIAGTRDAVRRLALEHDPNRSPASSSPGIGSSSPIEGLTEPIGIEYPKEKEKRPFWKRKPSSGSGTPVSPPRSVSAQLGVPGTMNGIMAIPGRRHLSGPDGDFGGHCTAILRDLDLVVSEFTALIAESKHRRRPVPVPIVSANSRQSMESNSDQEFFDAEGGETGNDSQLLYLNRDSEDEVVKEEEEYFSDSDSASNSDVEGAGSFDKVRSLKSGSDSLFPPKPKTLSPLPLDPVRRRGTVPASTILPPSLIGFLRKNVGKDLSTISMPVSANEPLSILQRISEIMEYTSLLDASVNANTETGERLLHIAAYAISTFSNSRVRERSLRKPFNPMLGETFELVREDRGFRFIAEKVSHRPVRMACQAESKNWTLTQSPMPTQKFWGKSVELNTEGRVRVVLHSTGDRYSWTGATCFLRNIIAGEKYVEPVGTMTVINETNGQKAVVTFKAKGMFSGRSEEVDVQTFDDTGERLPLGLCGKWTAGLALIDTATGTETKHNLWNVGDLVDNSPARYGFTAFAAGLNEVTGLEKGRLPPSDSRLRPDQRAAEQGSLERAEELKTRLEEAQRRRRREMDERGEDWIPKWFVKVPGAEDEWRYKTGKDSYWEERIRGSWEGVAKLFDT